LRRVRWVARAGVQGTNAKKEQSDWARAGNRIKRLFQRDPEAGLPSLLSLVKVLQAALDSAAGQN